MRYYIDTEFIEYPCTIDLISIGIVAEDGRQMYAVSSQFYESKASDWVKENVISRLGGGPRYSRTRIKEMILNFVGNNTPEFWGYYADYDWVVFCWLFGRMVDLPYKFTRYCKDFKQSMDEWGLTKKDLPTMSKTVHHALDDARWLRDAHNAAINICRF